MGSPDAYEPAAQARTLPADERSRLVDLLLESLHESPLAEVEAAWAREIDPWVAAYERGEVETFAAEDVFAEARRIAPGARRASRGRLAPKLLAQTAYPETIRKGLGARFRAEVELAAKLAAAFPLHGKPAPSRDATMTGG